MPLTSRGLPITGEGVRDASLGESGGPRGISAGWGTYKTVSGREERQKKARGEGGGTEGRRKKTVLGVKKGARPAEKREKLTKNHESVGKGRPRCKRTPTSGRGGGMP